jgi:HK97 family phage portal protein
MKIIDWLGGIFSSKQSTISVDTLRADSTTEIALEAFALFTTIEMIARLTAKCEFRTYYSGKESKGLEWANLNYRPNVNQNATEFWQEVVCKLLYHKEVLIIPYNNQKIIADDFQKDEYALTGTVFSGVSRGDFSFASSFPISDVYYLKYTSNDVQRIIDNIFAMYQKLIVSASEKYIKAGKEKGILNVSAKAQNSQSFENDFKNLMNDYFKSYFDSSVNSVLPLFEGYSYDVKTDTGGNKYSNNVADIKTLVDEALSRAAQALGVPPALIRGDVAGIKDAYDIMLTGCIDPIAEMISEELTGKQFSASEISEGNRICADTSCIKHIDIFDIATSADKLISSSILSPDEAREKAGIVPTGEKWAQMHYITKNYASVEGGENGEKPVGN